MWGILPLFIVLCLAFMDSASITFYRFIFAGFVLVMLLHPRKRLSPLATLSPKQWGIALLAAVCLVINYVTNVMGLEYLSPGTVQLLMQIAPLALMVGGLVFYKELLNRYQFVGLVTLLIGLGLFFSQRLPDIISSDSEEPIGIFIIVGSALVWACYALLQKGLMKEFSSNQVNVVLYLSGAILLIPLTDFSSVLQLDGVAICALLFCCVNTLLAYGAFAEALRIWDASRVSAVLSCTPLITLVSNHVASVFWPETFIVPDMNIWAYVGAGIVIVGSMICALAKQAHKMS
jgi:drug/metabolite transporter (DMT)-like permease